MLLSGKEKRNLGILSSTEEQLEGKNTEFGVGHQARKVTFSGTLALGWGRSSWGLAMESTQKVKRNEQS